LRLTVAKEVPSIDDCATSKMLFETPAELALEAAFDGGRITSDGEPAWLAKTDAELGVCEAIARQMPEWRKRDSTRCLP